MDAKYKILRCEEEEKATPYVNESVRSLVTKRHLGSLLAVVVVNQEPISVVF
jgi:hypothetical protein